MGKMAVTKANLMGLGISAPIKSCEKIGDGRWDAIK